MPRNAPGAPADGGRIDSCGRIVMFKTLGVLVLLYVCYAAYAGEVVAKAGIGSTRVSREDAPGSFWVIIVIYTGLGIALLTVF